MRAIHLGTVMLLLLAFPAIAAEDVPMPSIEQLDQITVRLVILGLAMLSAGILGGVISYRSVGKTDVSKVILAWVVWIMYAGLIGARFGLAWRGRRVAWCSVIAFVVVLIALLTRARKKSSSAV